MTIRNSDFKQIVEDHVVATQEFMARYDARHAEVKSESDALRERIETLEARASNPVLRPNSESSEHVKRFTNWLRKPNDSATKQALGDFQEKLTHKSVN